MKSPACGWNSCSLSRVQNSRATPSSDGVNSGDRDEEY
jgi:hypothetical protein